MGKNANYDFWIKSIQQMSEQDLMNAIHSSGGYHQEYIQIVRNRLVNEFHHSQQEIDDELLEAEVKYRSEKIAAETDKQLSMTEKILVMLGFHYLPIIALVFVLYERNRKVENS